MLRRAAVAFLLVLLPVAMAQAFLVLTADSVDGANIGGGLFLLLSPWIGLGLGMGYLLGASRNK